jgi:hypothetical protein
LGPAAVTNAFIAVYDRMMDATCAPRGKHVCAGVCRDRQGGVQDKPDHCGRSTERAHVTALLGEAHERSSVPWVACESTRGQAGRGHASARAAVAADHAQGCKAGAGKGGGGGKDRTDVRSVAAQC